MDRPRAKKPREARPLSDHEIVSLERSTAIGCLRAAREQLELAAVSMTIVRSVDGDEDTFRDADALIEAAAHIAHTLERQIALRAELPQREDGAVSSTGISRAPATRGNPTTASGASSAARSTDDNERPGRVVH